MGDRDLEDFSRVSSECELVRLMALKSGGSTIIGLRCILKTLQYVGFPSLRWFAVQWQQICFTRFSFVLFLGSETLLWVFKKVK